MTRLCSAALAALLLLAPASAFTVCRPSTMSTAFTLCRRSTTPTALFGIIDDLKLIFSEEGRANRRAFEEAERDEQERALKEIQARRRNPEAMEQYEQEVQERREILMNERAKWDFQTPSSPDVDPKAEWDRLRAEGEIKVGSDLERDESSSRLGSEGLVDQRVDELLPYIDAGYVPEEDQKQEGEGFWPWDKKE